MTHQMLEPRWPPARKVRMKGIKRSSPNQERTYTGLTDSVFIIELRHYSSFPATPFPCLTRLWKRNGRPLTPDLHPQILIRQAYTIYRMHNIICKMMNTSIDCKHMHEFDYSRMERVNNLEVSDCAIGFADFSLIFYSYIPPPLPLKLLVTYPPPCH